VDRQRTPHPPESLGSVVVLGGGLAGMAAAWKLTAWGYRVTVVERRPYLGGRAYSFEDRETGQQVDNGQHVFLGCCTSFTDFLDEIGTLGLTDRQRSLRIEVRSPTGRRGILSALPLPPPLHLLASLLRYPHVSWADKLRTIPAMALISLERRRHRPQLEAMSFHDWLRSHGQTQRAIENFWELLILPSLNDRSRNVSASMAFMVFQEALLWDRHGAEVGYARVGLSQVMGSAVETQLRERGVTLRLGSTAEGLLADDMPASGTGGRIAANSMVTGVNLTGGEVLRADWYVSAVPPSVLLGLLPEPLRDLPKLSSAANQPWSPIVNLHVWYDRPVADFDFAAFVESPVQWVFNKSRIGELDGPGQYITVSLSGAWEFWPMGKQALEDLFVPELARVLPQAGEAKIERFVVVKEQRATFQPLPGTASYRPPAETPLPNLFLAGDWTDTGWPATLEGAVRSGVTAAERIHAKMRRW
jgi:squalene-associated FAD-dependent desaturase